MLKSQVEDLYEEVVKCKKNKGRHSTEDGDIELEALQENEQKSGVETNRLKQPMQQMIPQANIKKID